MPGVSSTNSNVYRSMSSEELRKKCEKYNYYPEDYHKEMQAAQQKETARREAKQAERLKKQEDDRRQSQEKHAASTQKPLPSLFVPNEVDSPTPATKELKRSLPDWSNEILPRQLAKLSKEKSKKTPESRQLNQACTALNRLKDSITECENETDPGKREKLFDRLRNLIHQAEFLPGVTKTLLIYVHILDNGLARIFTDNRTIDNNTPNQYTVDFPWDLKADAEELYKRWWAGVTEVEVLRGIDHVKDRIDPEWRKAYPCPANYYGQGQLLNGQWWPSQLCTVRDGAHGAAQGGIYGTKGKGAFSIVVAGGAKYDDKDNGDEIFYSGTDGKDDTATENTNRLIESCTTVHEPVRVIRSSNLSPKDPYRPQRGYRYDGLYDVVGYKVVDKAKAGHMFHLVRCKGQDPIRYEKDKPSTRPTIYEIERYDIEWIDRRNSQPPLPKKKRQKK